MLHVLTYSGFEHCKSTTKWLSLGTLPKKPRSSRSKKTDKFLLHEFKNTSKLSKICPFPPFPSSEKPHPHPGWEFSPSRICKLTGEPVPKHHLQWHWEEESPSFLAPPCGSPWRNTLRPRWDWSVPPPPSKRKCFVDNGKVQNGGLGWMDFSVLSSFFWLVATCYCAWKKHETNVVVM